MRTTRRMRIAVIAATVLTTATVVLADAVTDPVLVVMPNPVVVVCPGGSAQFTIRNATGAPGTINITSFQAVGSCATYGITPGSAMLADGQMATFMAHAGPAASVPGCDFTIYIDNAPSPFSVRVDAPTCGAGSGQLALTPSSILFGDVTTGTSLAKSFTSLQNQTFVELTSLTFTVTGAGFEMGYPCAAGQTSCNKTYLVGAGIPPTGYFIPAPEVVCHPNANGPLGGMFTVSGSGSTSGPWSANATLTCNGVPPTSAGPDIFVSPTSLNRTATIGNSDAGTMPLRIENQGDQNLVVSNIRIVGADAAAWSTTTCAPCTIPPTGHTDVTVTYTASAVGSQDVTLYVDSNDVDEASVPVSAFGTGQGGILVVTSPASGSIDFGQVPIPMTSTPPEQVIVRNDGNVALTVPAMVTMGGGTFSVTPASRVVQPGFGNERTFDVTCTAGPPADSLVTGRLEVGSGSPEVISLRCMPVTSSLSISPSSLDFGPVRVGDTVMSVPITVSTTTQMTIGTPTFAPPTTELAVVGFPTPGSMLQPGNPITFTVEYTPDAEGVDTVSLKDLVTEEPTRAIAITGTGAIASGAIDPQMLDLGSVCVGDLASGSLTLSATGSAPFVADMPRIDKLEFDVQNAADSGTQLPATLTPGATATVDINVIAPEGPLTGTLTWATDLPAPLADVPLAVSGIAAGVAATPGSIDFGPQPVATTSAPRTIQLKACGGQLYVVNAEIVGGEAGVFAFQGDPQVAVGATEVEPWMVTFTPPADGVYHAVLRLTVTGDPTPIDIGLDGVGGDGEPDGGITNYYACGCDAPLDAGGAIPGLIVIAVLLVPRRRRRT